MATNQEIRDSGLNFISDTYYHKNPFNLQTPIEEETGNTGGITSTNAAIPYMGYPSYAAYLAAQGVGGGGDGGDEEDGPSYGNMIGKGPLHGVPPQSIFSRLQNIPTPFNLARKGITWGIDKFGEWNEARKEKKQAAIDMSHKIEGRSFRPGGAGSPESGKGGAPGTSKGEGGWKGAYGGRVRFFYGGLASIL